uniref:30S ribosomal protein S10 n=1 Tax=Bakuella subtropica TaxID=1295181 RepID=UPI0023F0E3E2|nr:30S ribosomal protein S10 [Bakuella subtropica]WDY80864.1 30S ribosomal protein S10 [Bakuella subtropica]
MIKFYFWFFQGTVEKNFPLLPKKLSLTKRNFQHCFLFSFFFVTTLNASFQLFQMKKNATALISSAQTPNMKLFTSQWKSFIKLFEVLTYYHSAIILFTSSLLRNYMFLFNYMSVSQPLHFLTLTLNLLSIRANNVSKWQPFFFHIQKRKNHSNVFFFTDPVTYLPLLNTSSLSSFLTIGLQPMTTSSINIIYKIRIANNSSFLQFFWMSMLRLF